MTGNFVRRLLRHGKLPPLERDDDLTIETRYPRFHFVDDPKIRALQRKCLMRAEDMRSRPHLYSYMRESDLRYEALSKAKAQTPQQIVQEAFGDWQPDPTQDPLHRSRRKKEKVTFDESK